jgi:hypothetical protein
MLRLPAAVLLLTTSFVASSATKLLEHIPLVWRPTSSLRLGTMQMPGTTVTFGAFTDGRERRGIIGENREDETPKPVSTDDDVGAFVGVHMRQLFDGAGIKTVDSGGAVIVKGDVRKFFVREGSTYTSEVAVQLIVSDADGKILWKGIASGEATRFGRSYKAENYFEVLSDAVVNTVSSMLQAPEFQRALSGHIIGSST